LPWSPGGAAALGRQSQSAGGSAIPHTFPWLYNATPTRKNLPSVPSGRQLATRPEALPAPGSSLSITGVSSGKACAVRKPQPCGLINKATHCAENGCLRSMLVTTRGISTRKRVLRLVDLGVKISMSLIHAVHISQHPSLTEFMLRAVLRKSKRGNESNLRNTPKSAAKASGAHGFFDLACGFLALLRWRNVAEQTFEKRAG